MPIYDLQCGKCRAIEEVIILGGEVEPTTCSVCGGKLSRLPSRFGFRARCSEPSGAKPIAQACGHSGACRCAVKLDRPNPFEDRLSPPTT